MIEPAGERLVACVPNSARVIVRPTFGRPHTDSPGYTVDMDPNAHESTLRRAAVIDVGSSTATLALYQERPGGTLERAARVAHPLGLARELDDRGALNRAAVDRLVDTVREFALRSARFGVPEPAAV